jgi:hypothetical protein
MKNFRNILIFFIILFQISLLSGCSWVGNDNGYWSTNGYWAGCSTPTNGGKIIIFILRFWFLFSYYLVLLFAFCNPCYMNLVVNLQYLLIQSPNYPINLILQGNLQMTDLIVDSISLSLTFTCYSSMTITVKGKLQINSPFFLGPLCTLSVINGVTNHNITSQITVGGIFSYNQNSYLTGLGGTMFIQGGGQLTLGFKIFNFKFYYKFWL